MGISNPGLSAAQFSATSLFHALANENCDEAQVSASSTGKYLLGYLTHLKAATIVVEPNYIDRDYLDDFSAYYVRCFTDYSRRCTRLHFFQDIEPQEALTLIRSVEPEGVDVLQKAYLGFVVARPLPSAVVGRTVLSHYPSDGDRRHYTAVRDYEANLAGLRLRVESSLAFQEQDSVLAACATVALWSCFQKTSTLFSSPAPTPSEITRSANQDTKFGRSFPSHGLNVYQICSAITRAGLEPEVFEVSPRTPLASLVYSYLCMGLPVLLGVKIEGQGKHAVTLAGYSLKADRVRASEIAAKEAPVPALTGLRIDELYAHDDQFGPFSRLRIEAGTEIGSTSFPSTLVGSWTDGAKDLRLYPLFVVVPVYHKIRLTFSDVLVWVSRLNHVMAANEDNNESLEWDIRLSTSNAHKRELRKDAATGEGAYGPLLERGHPRYVWILTLRQNGKQLLQLLGDATDMARSFPFYEASWTSPEFRESMKQVLSLGKIENLLVAALTPKLLKFLRSTLS